MKKITIGSAVYDDPEGVWYTYQSLRLNNQEILDEIDFIIIDNHPEGLPSKDTRAICRDLGIRYVPSGERRTTAIRNKIFELSETPWTMCIDSHILFEPRTIKNFLVWVEANDDCEDLLQGPLMYDFFEKEKSISTHMKPTWRAMMYGIWDCDKRGEDKNAEPFEIPMQGLGVFACKTDKWLPFHPLFIGFGGEEGYIHEKFRKNGRKTLCLPFLRWLHKFRKSEATPYPNIVEERIHNYTIGLLDNGKSLDAMRSHFEDTFDSLKTTKVIESAKEIFEAHKESPDLIEEMFFDGEYGGEPEKIIMPEDSSDLAWSGMVFNEPPKKELIKKIKLEVIEIKKDKAYISPLWVFSKNGQKYTPKANKEFSKKGFVLNKGESIEFSMNPEFPIHRFEIYPASDPFHIMQVKVSYSIDGETWISY